PLLPALIAARIKRCSARRAARHDGVLKMPARAVVIATGAECPIDRRFRLRKRPIKRVTHAEERKAAKRLRLRDGAVDVLLRAEIVFANLETEPGIIVRDEVFHARNEEYGLLNPRFVFVIAIPKRPRRPQTKLVRIAIRLTAAVAALVVAVLNAVGLR